MPPAPGPKHAPDRRKVLWDDSPIDREEIRALWQREMAQLSGLQAEPLRYWVGRDVLGNVELTVFDRDGAATIELSPDCARQLADLLTGRSAGSVTGGAQDPWGDVSNGLVTRKASWIDPDTEKQAYAEEFERARARAVSEPRELVRLVFKGSVHLRDDLVGKRLSCWACDVQAATATPGDKEVRVNIDLVGTAADCVEVFDRLERSAQPFEVGPR